MHKRLAIMIDQDCARLVRLDEIGIFKVERIDSEIEPKVKSTGHVSNMPAHGFGGAQSSEITHLEHRRQAEEGDFYDRVVRAIGDVKQVAVIGHKPARERLAKLIAEQRPDAKVVGVEGVDRLTDGALVAKARELLGVPLARMQL